MVASTTVQTQLLHRFGAKRLITIGMTLALAAMISFTRVIGAATVHGYTTAFGWAAGIFGVGLLVALLVLPASDDEDSSTEAQAQASVAAG